MAFDRNISLKIDDSDALYVKVRHIEGDEIDQFCIEIFDHAGGQSKGKAVWDIIPNNGTFGFQLAASEVALGICLSACFADIMTSDLAECLKSAKNRSKVKQCLLDHGFWQALKSIHCVYSCLAL